VKSYGYARNDDWLALSNPSAQGDAILIEGATDSSNMKLRFHAFIGIEEVYSGANLRDSDLIRLQVIAGSRLAMLSQVCFDEAIRVPDLEVEVDLSSFRSLADVRLDVIVVAELDPSIKEFFPGRPYSTFSILANKMIDLKHKGAGIPYFNIYTSDFSTGVEDAPWEMCFEWDTLNSFTPEEMLTLDISRILSLRVNTKYADEYSQSSTMQALAIFDLAKRSIESFFALEVSHQLEVLGYLGSRRRFDGNWLQWLRWQFRDSFGQAFLESNRTNLGVVTQQWFQRRENVEARLRSKIMKRTK